jgi:hypothetical protein
MQRVNSRSTAFVIAALSILGANAAAEEVPGERRVHPLMTSKYALTAGLYAPKKGLFFRVDGTLPGPENGIDFDKRFDVGDYERVFEIEYLWRFGQKWLMRGQHFSMTSDAKAVLEEDVQWGDVTLEAGSSVSAGTGFASTRLFFGRRFNMPPGHEAGWGLGVHWMKIRAYLERDLIISFADVSTVKASGPFPNFGAWYFYSPNEHWILGGQFDWLEATVGDYSGGIANFSIGANYQFTKHFGIGADYQVFSLAADIRDQFWRGRTNLDFAGSHLYLSATW